MYVCMYVLCIRICSMHIASCFFLWWMVLSVSLILSKQRHDVLQDVRHAIKTTPWMGCVVLWHILLLLRNRGGGRRRRKLADGNPK
jgi:hypothetical protein